jgi:transcription-repair coupling factor (superfamily II helicase)
MHCFRSKCSFHVDEEHRFGVRHKERLKQLREGVHVLTLTATPIPRTLQLAMTSVRELSLILTPPKGRRPVLTRMVEETSPKLDEALRRGRRRNGRSFYVCPRIADLDAVAWRLAERVPELRVARAHGRLRARELDEIIQNFAEGAFDVLLSTTIVESGLDVPNANTIIVQSSDRLGSPSFISYAGGLIVRPGRRTLCSA